MADFIRYVPPTIIKDIPLSDSIPLMQEEIFGPVLAICPVENWQSAIDYVNSRPHPLALYICSSSHKFKSMVIDNTLSGSVVCNDMMTQFAQSTLPFGGVGESGLGS
jgi:acyl-CoA reductase-like NAD-dependent aldehyde dehydrogenase